MSISMSDQYYSRLLTAARQNKNVKNIKDVKDNIVTAVMLDGTEQMFDWKEIFDFSNLLNNNK